MKNFNLQRNFEEDFFEKENLISCIDIDFLISIANPIETPSYELQNKERCTRAELWQNILKEGLKEPFFITFSEKLQTIRLESGNHRVRIFKEMGIKKVLCVGILYDNGILFEGNGKHTYPYLGNAKISNVKAFKIFNIQLNLFNIKEELSI